MDNETPICVETQLESDGVLTLTGLPFRAGDRLIVQVGPAAANGARKFPMRGRPYCYIDPFEPVVPADEWEAER